jgi:membrane protease YdiL (CAAX protease family)
MSQFQEPENVDLAEKPPRPFRGSRKAWAIHLLILGAYPLMMAAMSVFSSGGDGGAALSPSLPQLFMVVVSELVLFAVWFGAAWGFSGVSFHQLMFRLNHLVLTPIYGFLYSVGLRFGVGVVMVITLVAVAGLSGGNLSDIAEDFRPDIEKVVDTDHLESNSTYLIVNCTVVSFVLAGFREELWRVGMIAGLFALFPKLDTSVWGRLGAVASVALLFGLGHAVQGAGAVWLTFLLGLGLGGIIVFHRSIWEAVIAHGFFDASTFVMIFVIKRYFPDAIPGF